MSSYRAWLEGHKAAAKARGGRPLPFIPAANGDLLLTGNNTIKGRAAGELFNAKTGEFITGCLTIGKLATEQGTTSGALYSRLEALGIMHSVLDWKDVPTLSKPPLRRPEYFHRYRLTPWALEESYGITIVAQDGKPLDLITPDGQSFIRKNLQTATGATIGDQIARLFTATPWLDQSEIARKLGCSQSTVSRHMKRMGVTALPAAAWRPYWSNGMI